MTSRWSVGWEHRRAIQTLAFGLSSLGVLACAAAEPLLDLSSVEAHGECVNVASVSGFRVLDDRRILIDTRPQKVIELYSDCTGLRFVEDIALEGRAGELCDYRGDKIIVDGRRCTVASIREYAFEADRDLDREFETKRRGD